jgi:hypothetical protein
MLAYWLTALINGYRNVSFIFECNLRNCQRLSHEAFQSYVPLNKDLAKEHEPNFCEPGENTKYISNKFNFSMVTTTVLQILILKVKKPAEVLI